MDKQKEIERMADVKRIARILCEDDNGESVHDEITCGNYIECAFTIKAQRLLDEGYGDVKQAVREFAEKIKENLEEIFDLAVRKNWGSAYEYINELVKEVGGE